MAWCDDNNVHYVFGLARNARLEAGIAEAKEKVKASGKAERIFKDFQYTTRKSWSRERRAVATAYRRAA